MAVPPEQYMLDTPIPGPFSRTNAGLAEGFLAHKGALEQCNVDKASLRQWVQAAKK